MNIISSPAMLKYRTELDRTLQECIRTMQQQGNNEGTVTAKIKIELRADQRADLIKAAKDIGATAVLDVLDEARAYKSWVVFKSYLDRAIVEKGETES